MSSQQSRPVVVFDGECRFCLKQIARFQRLDRDGVFEYVARQTPGLEERFSVLREADFDTGMRLIAADGHVHVGADAVYAIARRLPWSRSVAWLYRVPGIRGISRWGYAWVAAHRHRLGGRCKDDSCGVT